MRDLCRTLGASAEDLVSFEKYAAAAHFLKGPSSAARALASGAAHIERVDKLVQLLALQRRMESPVLNEIVERVDQELSRNRREVSA